MRCGGWKQPLGPWEQAEDAPAPEVAVEGEGERSGEVHGPEFFGGRLLHVEYASLLDVART